MTPDNEQHISQGGEIERRHGQIDGIPHPIVPEADTQELFDLFAAGQLIKDQREHELDITEAQQEQDVPIAEPGETSSVGPLWPPKKSSFERIKGICTQGIVRTKEEMWEVIDEIAQASLRFRKDGVTRVSLRAVIDNDYLAQMQDENPEIATLIEARFDLAGTQPTFENSSLVYLGKNHPSRRSIQKDTVDRNIEDALKYSTLDPREIINRATSQGYRISFLPMDLDQIIIDQMSALYARFGWDREEVEAMLSNPNAIKAVASLDGQIVSAGMIELVKIPIGNAELRIAEITEAATIEEHSRKGLYAAVSTSLLVELARRSRQKNVLGGEVDLFIGEGNALAPGVLRTAMMQGRVLAAGNSGYGILSQHAPIASIDGTPRLTSYNDLAPTAMPREKIYSYTKDYLNETT